MHDDEEAEIGDIFKMKKLPAVLGSQNLISWVKERFYSEKQDKQIPDSSVLAPDIFQIKRLISEYYEINPSELSNTHRGVTNEPGDVAIFLTRKPRHDTLPIIGNEFGMRGYKFGRQCH